MLRKVDSQEPDSKVFLVTKVAQSERISTYIKDTKAQNPSKELVLGMDCEGLNVTKSLSLLQVSHLNH